MATQRDDFWAGLFLLVGIALTLVVIFILADFRMLTQSYQQVQVLYLLEDGVDGLKHGAVVELGGLPVGSVDRIEDQLEDGKVTGKLVTFSLPADYRLHGDAVIELEKPPIGGGTALNIRYVGRGDPYQAGDPPLEGRRANSDLVRDMVRELGIKEAQKQQLRQIIDNVTSITTGVRSDYPVMSKRVKGVVDQAGPVLAKAEAAVADIQATAKDTRALVADARERSNVWFARADAVSKNIDDSAAQVRLFLKEKDPVVRESVDNVQAVTRRVREQTLDQIATAIGKADHAMDNARQITSEVKAFTAQQRPTLERAMASFQLTAAQLKLASIEIRRSPWRLLYKPTEQELESDNLYDAARSFAQAAEVLDATAESLRVTAGRQDIGQDEVRRMIQRLERLFAEYDKAEKAFWDALDAQPQP